MGSSREELIYLLNEAAELEHMLACQYLFAVFSLKRSVDDEISESDLATITNWGQILFLIAREEMSHLGIVSNLLTAIGACPNFQRHNFPQKKQYYPFPMELLPFGDESLIRFIGYERPAHATDPRDPGVPSGPPPLEPNLLTPKPSEFNTVGELYELIRKMVEELDERDLFIGPPDAQVTSSPETGLAFPHYNALRKGVFDVDLLQVCDKKTALTAIDTIIAQGEGAPCAAELSHYMRLLEIFVEFQNLRATYLAMPTPRLFQPARNTLRNPTLEIQPDAPGANKVTNEPTRQVMDVFNCCYELMLRLLLRFYAHTDESAADLGALRYTLFPMMTMVIRPLAEILTQMPAGNGQLAGPSFELAETIQFLPHKKSAWIILVERMQNAAEQCNRQATVEGIPPRLHSVAESLTYMANRFKEAVDTTGTEANAQHQF